MAAHLLELADDAQRVIFTLLSDALRPAVMLELSACCRDFRTVSEAARTELTELAARAELAAGLPFPLETIESLVATLSIYPEDSIIQQNGLATLDKAGGLRGPRLVRSRGVVIARAALFLRHPC